jgi:hypothetical protein
MKGGTSDPATGSDADRRAPSTDDGPDAQPRPGWIRYSLLTVFFAVVGIGLVVALYDKGLLPIAGPFVVIFLLPLLVPLRRRGLRYRSHLLATRLDEQLATLALAIGQERSTPAGRRDSGAGDGSLASASASVDSARRQVAHGQQSAAAGAVDELSRMASASWRSGASLTKDVAGAAGTARHLQRVLQQPGRGDAR